jgi:hypothetical protein
VSVTDFAPGDLSVVPCLGIHGIVKAEIENDTYSDGPSPKDVLAALRKAVAARV